MEYHGDFFVAQAQRAKSIMASGRYIFDGVSIDLSEKLAQSCAGVRIIKPNEWDNVFHQSTDFCKNMDLASITVTTETTLAALERLIMNGKTNIAALNFASAIHPGGGWDRGALAQEETLARASGLVASLQRIPEFYQANRDCSHLFYTDHAIWSPAVPFFCHDDGTLLKQPYTADIITMPAPNVGGIEEITENELRSLPALWRHRIRCVLALAITNRTKHLVLGSWGCGSFGNDPITVARRFSEILHPKEPWRRGLETITFAIYDTSRSQSCINSFKNAFQYQENTP